MMGTWHSAGAERVTMKLQGADYPRTSTGSTAARPANAVPAEKLLPISGMPAAMQASAQAAARTGENAEVQPVLFQCRPMSPRLDSGPECHQSLWPNLPALYILVLPPSARVCSASNLSKGAKRPLSPSRTANSCEHSPGREATIGEGNRRREKVRAARPEKRLNAAGAGAEERERPWRARDGHGRT